MCCDSVTRIEYNAICAFAARGFAGRYFLVFKDSPVARFALIWRAAFDNGAVQRDSRAPIRTRSTGAETTQNALVLHRSIISSWNCSTLCQTNNRAVGCAIIKTCWLGDVAIRDCMLQEHTMLRVVLKGAARCSGDKSL